MTQRAEEDFLRRKRHADRIDAVDLHAAVDQGAGAVIGADGDGELELGHVEGILAFVFARSFRGKAARWQSVSRAQRSTSVMRCARDRTKNELTSIRPRISGASFRFAHAAPRPGR